MAVHDYVIANGTGQAVRQDLNNALAAIVSNNSSSTEPGTTYAYQWWADTNANLLKLRNSSNDGWITLRELDGTMLIEDGSASTPGLAFADDVNTGIFSPAADQIGFATGGVERLEIGSSEVVFNDPSNDVNFRVESNGETHMLFVDAGNDRVGIGVSTPKKDLHVDNTVLLTGSAPQVRLSTDGNDASDDNRAMFGLCTSAGNFFGGSAVGDTVIRTTNGGNILFGEGTTERVRMDEEGKFGIGLTPAEKFHVDCGAPSSSDKIIGQFQAESARQMYLGWDDSQSTMVLGTLTNHPLAIHTNGQSGTERIRIDADGVKFNGDTAAANALSDYEEGTFTPTIQGSTTAGTHTYSQQVGKYTKVGDRVFFELYIHWDSGTGAGSALYVYGLPYQVHGGNQSYPATTIGYFHNISFASNSSPGALCASGSTYVYFYAIPNGGGSNAAIAYDSAGSMIISGHYKVN